LRSGTGEALGLKGLPAEVQEKAFREASSLEVINHLGILHAS
jgi:hypothetical protein